MRRLLREICALSELSDLKYVPLMLVLIGYVYCHFARLWHILVEVGFLNRQPLTCEVHVLRQQQLMNRIRPGFSKFTERLSKVLSSLLFFSLSLWYSHPPKKKPNGSAMSQRFFRQAARHQLWPQRFDPSESHRRRHGGLNCSVGLKILAVTTSSAFGFTAVWIHFVVLMSERNDGNP